MENLKPIKSNNKSQLLANQPDESLIDGIGGYETLIEEELSGVNDGQQRERDLINNEIRNLSKNQMIPEHVRWWCSKANGTITTQRGGNTQKCELKK